MSAPYTPAHGSTRSHTRSSAKALPNALLKPLQELCPRSKWSTQCAGGGVQGGLPLELKALLKALLEALLEASYGALKLY